MAQCCKFISIDLISIVMKITLKILCFTDVRRYVNNFIRKTFYSDCNKGGKNVSNCRAYVKLNRTYLINYGNRYLTHIFAWSFSKLEQHCLLSENKYTIKNYICYVFKSMLFWIDLQSNKTNIDFLQIRIVSAIFSVTILPFRLSVADIE